MKKTENRKTKVKGNKKPFFTISKKILALSLLPMIIVCALVATVGAKALETGIEKQIEQSLQIVGVSVDETYTNLYEGDYTRDKGGKVRKGGTSISGETQLIDGLQEKTGFQVSFLYGNMRLITTLTKPEGGRINGTALEDDVYAQIQTGEALFLTDCNISEVDYYVYYQPLINSDGSVIGAIEVATPMQNVKDTISMQVKDIILIAVACVLVAATLVSVLSRSMVKTMKKTKHFLGRIVNGELDAEPDEKQCRKKDELGDVYRISVENSTAGSVHESYDLIMKYRFYIVGAYDLKIEHCLCAKSDTKYEDITDVYSHPQALSQCNNFLRNFDFTGINYSNTAAAAKYVSESDKNNIAVICSELAAKKYNLKILKRNIQNNNKNTTRFIVISKELAITSDAQKISLIFSLPHKTGSLYRVLGRFSMAGLNLTKIESRPIEDSDFSYYFYVDVLGNVNDEVTLDLICALSDELPEFEFLGNFHEGK